MGAALVTPRAGRSPGYPLSPHWHLSQQDVLSVAAGAGNASSSSQAPAAAAVARREEASLFPMRPPSAPLLACLPLRLGETLSLH